VVTLRSARVGIAVLALGCVAWLSAQAPSPATRQPSARSTTAPRTERAVPFAAGEVLEYDVAWENFLTAGSATIGVREKKPSYGSVAYYIVAEGQPTPLLARLYPLYYKADTLIDVYSLLPQRGSIFSREGSRTKLKVLQFDQAANKARYEVQTATTVVTPLTVPSRTQDALSALFAMRSLAFRPNTRTSMPVADAGEVYTLDLIVAGHEPVRTRSATMNAWRIGVTVLDATGAIATDRRFTIWFSDDARHVPVKLSAQLAVGTFNLVLRDSR
jgi:hypothetical protein